jgi:DNA-binding CsgD family transcriptional regulator
MSIGHLPPWQPRRPFGEDAMRGVFRARRCTASTGAAHRPPHALARTREWALTLDLRCRGAGAPWRAVGDASVLTARAHEIALLAAEPVSSRDIARRLHLSVRTVNNHLHRAYAKLGISGRAQLAAVLGEHGPLS